MVEDLTAQCLYWECARLLCLNEKNLMPPIHRLFDGPLFHSFCRLQHDGDSKGFVKEMMGRLMAMENDYKSSQLVNQTLVKLQIEN